ncbi:MAG: phenylacetate-CoA oxygenase subunit PaaJ [Flavobacteriales bacterium]|nr:phenylacetate-CoA oxygenase subunit PaaJ [Flavobacteriales bacterium]
MFNADEIKSWLEELPDPEIPVISIVELGIIRSIDVSDSSVLVSITPTYSGCPAMKQIEDDIVSTLKQRGIPNVEVKMVYSPAWTTDWISDAAKEKLNKYGIAPPEHSSIDKRVLMGLEERVVKCPQCHSSNTEMISQFGSTACKALYRCKDCAEPFDYFKCL